MMQRTSIIFAVLCLTACGAGTSSGGGDGGKPPIGDKDTPATGDKTRPQNPDVDGPEPLPERELRAGVGIDDFLAIGTDSYGSLKGLIGPGEDVQGRKFSRVFPAESLEVNFADTNSSGALDDNDRLVLAIAGNGYRGATPEGIMVGDSERRCLGIPEYSAPDFSGESGASAAFDAGAYDFFFNKGIFFGHEGDRITTIGIHRTFRQRPDGEIKPSEAALVFSSGTIRAGDGQDTGDPQSTHRGVLGDPDYSSETIQEIEVNKPPFGTIPVELTLSLDFYRLLGLQFSVLKHVKTDFQEMDVDHLVAVALFSPYYGKMNGTAGLGSTKAEVEAALGVSNSKVYEGENGKLFVYDLPSGLRFGVGYEGGGASGTAKALLFVLNFPEEQ